MIQTIKHEHVTWINIEDPEAKDVLFLKEKFELHPLVLEEFTSPSQRPRAEEFKNCLYLVLHIPLFDPKRRVSYAGELDIVLTKDHVITGYTKENLPLKTILNEVKENDNVKEKVMSNSSGFLLYFILEKLISSCFPKIDHISEKLEDIERKIFEGFEKEMVQELSIIKRDILVFRRTLKPQRTIMESLVQKNYHLLDKSLDQYFQELVGVNIRVWNALENNKEVVESLEETNNSLVSYNINEAMRFLTSVSLITFTLSVTTGIFSMIPFKSFEYAENQNTFWVVILFMTLITLTALYFFKKRNWL